MGGFAAFVTAMGMVAVIWGALLRYKARRIASAPHVKTGDAAARGPAAAGPKGAISVEGTVAAPQLLRSPVAGTECLYYEYTVKAAWKEGESSHTRELAKERAAAPFTIDDGSGAVPVEASAGGDFELTKSFDESKKTGLVGAFSSELVFGNLRVATGKLPLGAQYYVTEKVMAPAARLYVCGKALDGGRIGSPGWTSLILSPKSRDELIGATGASSKKWLRGGIVATAVGVVLGILSTLFGGGEKVAAAAPPPVTAVVSAAPAPEAAPEAPPAPVAPAPVKTRRHSARAR